MGSEEIGAAERMLTLTECLYPCLLPCMELNSLPLSKYHLLNVHISLRRCDWSHSIGELRLRGNGGHAQGHVQGHSGAGTWPRTCLSLVVLFLVLQAVLLCLTGAWPWPKLPWCDWRRRNSCQWIPPNTRWPRTQPLGISSMNKRETSF